MLQTRRVAQLGAHREELPEVELLPLVGDVDDPVGVELGDAAAHRGDVGGGVVEAAVALAHDADRHALLLQLHHQRTFAFDGEALLLQRPDGLGKCAVVVAFSARQIERHVQPLIDAVELVAADGDEALPDRAVFRIALLQLDQLGLAALEPGGLLFRAVVALHVDAFKCFDGQGIAFGVGQEGAVALDQQAELRPPVAQMVVGDHTVAEGAVDAVKGIADHSRADVADVHRLGHIGARVIDDHGATVPGVRDAEARRGGECCELLGQPLRGNGQVDETGAGDFGARQHRRQRQGGERCLGHGARRTAQGFGRLHRVVTLEIAKARVGRRLNADARPLLRFAERGPERLPYPLCQLRLTPVHCLIHCKTNLLTSF